MTDHALRPGWLCCALACLSLVTCVPKSEAAFTVSINGTQVVTDNSVGDYDTATGVLRYTGTIDGYDIRLTTSITALGSDGRTTQLHVRNLASDKTTTAPLVVTISQIDSTGNLVRTAASGSQPTGSWIELRGGGPGTAAELEWTNAAGAGEASFGPASGESGLSQTITLTGLRGGSKVVVTAGGDNPKGGSFGLLSAPAPPALMLLAVGVALVGAYQLRSNRLRPRV